MTTRKHFISNFSCDCDDEFGEYNHYSCSDVKKIVYENKELIDENDRLRSELNKAIELKDRCLKHYDVLLKNKKEKKKWK